MISKGVDKSRLTILNFGETKLLNHCLDGVPCTEELHKINRRTEFTFTFPSEKQVETK